MSNWPAAQAVNAGGDFAVNWDVFIGGTETDYVELRIENDAGDQVFSTAVAGLTRDALIPAGTLVSGKRYHCALLFAKVTDRNSRQPGVLGLASHYKQTHFTLQTSGL